MTFGHLSPHTLLSSPGADDTLKTAHSAQSLMASQQRNCRLDFFSRLTSLLATSVGVTPLSFSRSFSKKKKKSLAGFSETSQKANEPQLHQHVCSLAEVFIRPLSALRGAQQLG